MLILALDTTAKAASVAVADGERLLALYNIDNGLTQSELILPMAENVLKNLHLSFSDVELFAVSAGPGSFTGVRIGTAVIKGLAFGRDVPCVCISTLEELAENLAGLEGILVPVMDARRGQVYNALFRGDGASITRLTEDRAISIDDLATELEGFKNEKIYLSGDGYAATREQLLHRGIEVECTPPLLISENAYSVARVALSKYEKGEYTNDVGTLPTYLRVPQAERERLERLAAEGTKK
ncbi:MAG: tRNA (adenosine(37)-N6)-threonylcarbamoyltransferase complex dimerization subunit type 1 TsaB [Clostridia bacterium]|nr:tRNA (adenosine(37)-N6)-threonylcarbamoyltransferase complex dimerization subunit type 1 TsaB [Clostridia bacterium]